MGKMNGVYIVLNNKSKYVFGKFQTVQQVKQRVTINFLPHYKHT